MVTFHMVNKKQKTIQKNDCVLWTELPETFQVLIERLAWNDWNVSCWINVYVSLILFETTQYSKHW